jgi:hypothetical protein
VSASRGRDEISIWTDSKADLLEAVMKSGQRLLATEFAASSIPVIDRSKEELIMERVEEIELLGICDGRDR